jgi:hypothetical protein
MKYPVHAELPTWHVWSDGRAFTPYETKRMRLAWKHQREPGEKPRAFFLRARAAIEADPRFATELQR